MLENASWDRLRALFDAAAPLDAAGRRALLDREFPNDAELRRRVEALLLAHDEAASILASRGEGGGEANAGSFAADLTVDRTSPLGSTSLIDAQIGPYRLLEKLGEGGFGVVFLAEQRTPFHRKVALKLLRADANSAQVLARFDAERQALALMDHPNIATVYDAGATSQGQPYFVMELVAGSSITKFADEYKLTIDERLRLFLQLCDAIQHAHQKGVIHRDLKPSNVLVTSIDDKPQVKVIDFGVAKALGARLTEETLHTRAGMVLGTPEYMSPEQAAGGAGGVDTRSDVYSLGVILFELLTGEIPLGRKGLREAALEEMLRRIRTEEPPKLSTKLHSLGEAAREVAQRRRADLGSLGRRLAGDLEWIAFKALEKEPVRRYATPGALGEDIERSLSNRPISAHPPSAAYQLRKFAARRKGLVAFAATVFVLAVGSAIAMSAMYSKQRTETLKAERVNEFLQGMLAAADPKNARGEDVRVRDVLDRAAIAVEKELGNEPEVRIAILMTIGETYLNLGLPEEGLKVASEATSVSMDRFGRRNATTAGCMGLLGDFLFQTGSQDSGIAVLREVLEIREDISHGEGEDYAVALGTLAGRLGASGELEESEALHRRALDAFRIASGTNTENYAGALNDFAITQQDRGNFAEAESLYQVALETRVRLLGTDHPSVLTSMSNLASVLRREGKVAQAESLFRQSLEVGSRVFGESHLQMGYTLNNLGLLLKTQKRYAEAESSYQRAYAIFRKTLGEDDGVTVNVVNNLGALYAVQRRYDEAETLLRQALEIGRRVMGKNHPRVATSFHNLASVVSSTGKIVDAVQLEREAVAIRSKALTPGHPDLIKAEVQLAWYLLEAEETREAKQIAEKYLTVQPDEEKREPIQTAIAQHIVGSCLLLGGNTAAAESLLVSSAPVVVASPISSRAQKRRALERAASVLERVGKPAQAAGFRAQLDSLIAE